MRHCAEPSHYSRQSAFRFDVPAFYKEARRVLKPGGKLAAWCYSFPDIEHHAEADRVFRDFREDVLGPHKTDVMSHCERQYRDIAPSAQDFGTVERDTMPYRLETTVWHLVSAPHCLCRLPDS